MRRILSTEGRTRMNVQLSAKLLRDLKIVAAETGRTLSRVTEELLLHGIKTCSTRGYPAPDEPHGLEVEELRPDYLDQERKARKELELRAQPGSAPGQLVPCDSCGRSLPVSALPVHRENCRAAAADQEWSGEE